MLAGVSLGIFLVHSIQRRLMRSAIYAAIFAIPWAMIVYGASVQLAPATATQISSLAKHGLANSDAAEHMLRVFDRLGVHNADDLVFWRAKECIQILKQAKQPQRAACEEKNCHRWIFSPASAPPGHLRAAGRLLRVMP